MVINTDGQENAKNAGKYGVFLLQKMEHNCLSRIVYMMMEGIKKYLLLILALKTAKDKVEAGTLNEIL
jgi:hypothetical protein